MRNKRAKRIVSLVLSVAMLISQVGISTFAQTPVVETVGCTHHTEHTSECGYSVGMLCSHQHEVEKCSYIEAIAGKDCGFNTEEPAVIPSEITEHTHDEACGYAEAFVGTGCTHTHDETCGFVEETKCTFTKADCKICNQTGSGTSAPSINTTTITKFDELEQAVHERSVFANTALEDLNLPTKLAALGYTVAEDKVLDSGTPSEATTIEGVTWELNPKHEINKGNSTYDPKIGNYCFTPVLPSGYTLAEGVVLPEIWVKVIASMGEGAMLFAKAATAESPPSAAAATASAAAAPHTSLVVQSKPLQSKTIPRTITTTASIWASLRAKRV